MLGKVPTYLISVLAIVGYITIRLLVYFRRQLRLINIHFTASSNLQSTNQWHDVGSELLQTPTLVDVETGVSGNVTVDAARDELEVGTCTEETQKCQPDQEAPGQNFESTSETVVLMPSEVTHDTREEMLEAIRGPVASHLDRGKQVVSEG